MDPKSDDLRNDHESESMRLLIARGYQILGTSPHFSLDSRAYLTASTKLMNILERASKRGLLRLEQIDLILLDESFVEGTDYFRQANHIIEQAKEALHYKRWFGRVGRWKLKAEELRDTRLGKDRWFYEVEKF